VVAVNVDLSETEICNQRVARVQIERIPQTLAALQANAGLFKTRISKRIAEHQAEGEGSQCGFIREPDLQAMCRAETGGGSSQCGFIRNRDMQAACRAVTKKY